MMQYKKYPHAELISDWETLLSMSEEEVKALQEQWLRIKEENDVVRKELYELSNQKVEAIIKGMAEAGIDVYKPTRSVGRGRTYQAWFRNNVVNKVGEQYRQCEPYLPVAHMGKGRVKGIELSNNQSPTSLIELYIKLSAQYRSKVNQRQKQTNLLTQSIAWAHKNNFSITDEMSATQIIKHVHDEAVSRYLNTCVPTGQTVTLRHECDCGYYTIGEPRCHCGTRRIAIKVEGNIIDGFYYYTEAY